MSHWCNQSCKHVYQNNLERLKVSSKNQKLCIKIQSIFVFLDTTKVVDSGEKILISAELKGCVTWFIYILDLLWVRRNCIKFHHCRLCGTVFREGAFWASNSWAVQKRPILNRVKKKYKNMFTLSNLFSTSIDINLLLREMSNFYF